MMRAGKSPRYRRLRPEVDPGAEFSILYCRLRSMGSSRGQGSTSLIKGGARKGGAHQTQRLQYCVLPTCTTSRPH